MPTLLLLFFQALFFAVAALIAGIEFESSVFVFLQTKAEKTLSFSICNQTMLVGTVYTKTVFRCRIVVGDEISTKSGTLTRRRLARLES